MKKQILIITTTIMLTGIFSEKVFATSTEETARNFYAAIDAADAKTIQSIASSDFQFYNPFTPPLDVNGLVGFCEQTKAAFTGAQHKIMQVISTSNSATIIGTFMGKNTAAFNGIPPTNKDLSVDFIAVFEYDNTGRIKKMTAQNNSYSFMIQLGVTPDPMTQQGVAIVGAIYQKFGIGDIPGVINSLDENIVWDSHLNPMFKNARVYKGSQDVYNFFSELKAGSTILKFIPATLYQNGDKVYVPGAFDYTNLMDNKNYNVSWTMVWTIKNGKPVRFDEYFGTPERIK